MGWMSSLGKFAARYSLHVGSSLSSQPSHAFCLDKVEKIDSNDPPLALYEKKYICLDLSVGCKLYYRIKSGYIRTATACISFHVGVEGGRRINQGGS